MIHIFFVCLLFVCCVFGDDVFDSLHEKMSFILFFLRFVKDFYESILLMCGICHFDSVSD